MDGRITGHPQGLEILDLCRGRGLGEPPRTLPGEIAPQLCDEAVGHGPEVGSPHSQHGRGVRIRDRRGGGGGRRRGGDVDDVGAATGWATMPERIAAAAGWPPSRTDAYVATLFVIASHAMVCAGRPASVD